MRAPKTPAGGRRALYGAAALFFLAFSVLLGVDRYIWGHTLRSAPFYLRAAERCGEFLLPGILAFLAAWASRRPRGWTSCHGGAGPAGGGRAADSAGGPVEDAGETPRGRAAAGLHRGGGRKLRHAGNGSGLQRPDICGAWRPGERGRPCT